MLTWLWRDVIMFIDKSKGTRLTAKKDRVPYPKTEVFNMVSVTLPAPLDHATLAQVELESHIQRQADALTVQVGAHYTCAIEPTIYGAMGYVREVDSLLCIGTFGHYSNGQLWVNSRCVGTSITFESCQDAANFLIREWERLHAVEVA